MNPVEVRKVPVPAKGLNDAKKCGPHAELHLFLLRNMRGDTDPMEPRTRDH